MSTPGRKFGLLVVPISPDDGEKRDLAPGRTWRGRVADLVDDAQVAHWRKWLGSVSWEKMIEREHRLVMLTMPSKQPEVLDGENEELSAALHLIWRALLLTAPLRPISGESWILSGAIDVSDSRLLEVRSTGRLGPIVRPFYASRAPFVAGLPWRDGDDWLSRWLALVTELRANHAALPDAIRLAVLSYEEAHHQEEIEFRLPTFVRAAEAVLAIPKGPGASVFAERMLKLAPRLSKHWWVGVPDLATKLERLYQHRNECVHGKVPFLDLRSKGEPGADEAAWFEFLAELTARECLLYALRSPTLRTAGAARQTLEDAWASGALP